jgi:BirA family biotin operon repressor/biotin-[acetyl-CoA-carboxylase] ligase
MLVIENHPQIRKILPGFPPDTPSGTPIPETSELGPFELLLSRALFGEKSRSLVEFSAPADWRGDFWSSWYLAGDSRWSQYDVLRQVITDNRELPGHVVCLALQGTGFHGQNQRGWIAEMGNIHLTLGLRCDLPATETGLALTMLPAVAVVDALLKMGLPAQGEKSPQIKWVNDIQVAGKKLGGVLTSARSQNGRIRSVVLGIGLNVAVAPDVVPTVYTPQVTFLGEHMPLEDNGMACALAAVLNAVAERFEQLQSAGPGPLLTAYREASSVLGRQVEVHDTDGGIGTVRKGRVIAIGPDLSLVLSDDSRPVTSGRLVLADEG